MELTHWILLIPILIPIVIAFNRGITCFHREYLAGNTKAAAIIASIFTAIPWWFLSTTIIAILALFLGKAFEIDPGLGGALVLLAALSVIPAFITYIITISIIAFTSK